MKEDPVEDQQGVLSGVFEDRCDGAIIKVVERSHAHRFAPRQRRQQQTD
jgi:hypothetical protein